MFKIIRLADIALAIDTCDKFMSALKATGGEVMNGIDDFLDMGSLGLKKSQEKKTFLLVMAAYFMTVRSIKTLN